MLLIELTPGPNMAWLAGLAATAGRRAGQAAVAGVALGLLANGILAALGLAALLDAAPQLWNTLRFAGAAMMLWLAVETWRDAAPTGRPVAGSGRYFATGALINLLNPKAYLFFVVVAPEFTRGARLDLRSALVLALISVAIATLIHLLVVTAGARAHHWLSDPRRTRTVRRLFALAMVGIAASFVASGLR